MHTVAPHLSDGPARGARDGPIRRAMRRQGRAGLPVAAALVAVALAVAACGGGSPAAVKSTTTTRAPATSTSAPASAPATSTRAAFAAYLSCLEHHGVTLPSFGSGAPPAGGSAPTGSSPGAGGAASGAAGSPKFAAARAACAKLRPSGGFGFAGGAAPSSQLFAAYRNCLKIHGVTLPARPGEGAATGPSAAGRAPLAATATERAAFAACKALLPKGATPATGSTAAPAG